MNIQTLMSSVLSAALIVTSIPLRAEMIGTGQVLTQNARDAHVAQLQAFINRDEVRDQMEALGVDSTLASERVAALTDSELQQLSSDIENLPAGGDGLGIVLVVLLILILLEIVGAINIFPKI